MSLPEEYEYGMKKTPETGAVGDHHGAQEIRSGDGSHMFVFTNEKAGMKQMGSDEKERANRIIYEMSKNSSYFKQAEQQDRKVDTKVLEMKNKLRALDDSRKSHLTRQADKAAAEFEGQRELDNVCMVVDMDMFYAAVEIRDRPELADKPVAVGGSSMISTTNYHARKKGVRSAMPGFIGRKLCPELVFVNPDYQKYSKVAEEIRAIFREYDPRMRSYSLDEAYLNVTQALARRLNEGDVLEPRTPTEPPLLASPTGGTDLDSMEHIPPEQQQPCLPRTTVSPGEAVAMAAVTSLSSPSDQRCVSPVAHTDRGREWLVEGAQSQENGGLEGRRPEWARRRQRPRWTEDISGGGEDDEDNEDEDEGFRCTHSPWGGAGGSEGRGEKMRKEERRASMFKAARAMAEEIRRRIQEKTRLTASVGIGPNFMLAKIASDWNKPNGQWCIGGDRAEVLKFLHDLPVRKVGGVGKVTEKCLRQALGVVTCGDLFRERAACMHVMTPHTARWLLKLHADTLLWGIKDFSGKLQQEAYRAWWRVISELKVSLGIASSHHDVATEQAKAAGAVTRKQISKERTFGELHRPQDLLAKCREICDSLAAEMETKTLEAKTVGLKIKTIKFDVRTQDHTGQVYVRTADELYAIASTLLQREIRGASERGGALRLRLMGVKASSFRGQVGVALLPGQSTLDGFLNSRSCRSEAERSGGTVGVEIATNNVDTARVVSAATAAAATAAATVAVVQEGTGKAATGAAFPFKARGGGTLKVENDCALDLVRGEDLDSFDEIATPCSRVGSSRCSCKVARGGGACCEDGADGSTHEAVATRKATPIDDKVAISSTLAIASHSDDPSAAARISTTRGPRETVRLLDEGKNAGGARGSLAAEPAAAVNCPICGELLGAVSNAALNRHVDSCLGVSSAPEAGHGLGGGVNIGTRRSKPPQTSRKRAKVEATRSIETFLVARGRT